MFGVKKEDEGQLTVSACFFLASCSAVLTSSSVTPCVERLVSRTRLACAFRCVSDSSSRTGGTNDLIITENNFLIRAVRHEHFPHPKNKHPKNHRHNTKRANQAEPFAFPSQHKHNTHARINTRKCSVAVSIPLKRTTRGD